MQPAGGKTRCEECGQGKYQATRGATDCEACPAGRAALSSRSTYCLGLTNCPAGHYDGGLQGDWAPDTQDQQEASMACVPCPAGKHKPTAGAQLNCLENSICQPGTFNANATAGAYNSPRVGVVQKMVTIGATFDIVCEPCPPGTFNTEEAAVECKPWKRCLPGQGPSERALPSTTEDRTCVPCAESEFSTDGSACNPHRVCHAGTYIAAKGTGTEDTQCAACPKGMYTDSENQQECQYQSTCPAGKFVGSAPTAHSDKLCDACAPGSFSVDIDVPACMDFIDCEPGTHIMTNGAPAARQLAHPPCFDANRALSDVHGYGCGFATTSWCASFVAGTSTTDRSCIYCPHHYFTDRKNMRQCAPLRTCFPGQYVPVPNASNLQKTSNACSHQQWSKRHPC